MDNTVKLYFFDTRPLSLDDIYHLDLLTTEDLKEMEKYKCTEMKKEKIASLYLKKKYIGDFSLNQYGKPISKDKYFNISHSHGLVAIAISKEYEIGIDIELIEERKKDLGDFICTSEERAYIGEIKGFFEIWTSKESMVKCIGIGIRSKIKEIPALPINGLKEYQGDFYYSKCFKKDDFIISITVKNNTHFDVEM